MSEYKKPKELSGIGVFVNALYDACITKEGNLMAKLILPP